MYLKLTVGDLGTVFNLHLNLLPHPQGCEILLLPLKKYYSTLNELRKCYLCLCLCLAHYTQLVPNGAALTLNEASR